MRVIITVLLSSLTPKLCFLLILLFSYPCLSLSVLENILIFPCYIRLLTNVNKILRLCA
jgi:hypothetical protein